MRSSTDRAPFAPARLLSVTVALGLVAACGGGGGGGAPPPPPPPANQAPVFTSAASATTVENNGGAIYQAAAFDPEGGAVTFSIAGGADSDKFNLSGGQLSFKAPPNFELPTDSDGNNVYQVQIVASDGQTQTSLTVSVTVTNSKEGVAVRRIATGFNNPTAMAWIPGGFLLMIAEKNGAIYQFNPTIDLRLKVAQVPVSGQGVLAIVVPGIRPNGNFFVMYTNNNNLIVQEYERDPISLEMVPRSSGPVLQVAAPDYAGGGWLGFDSLDNLIIATGDAGGTGDPSGSAQNDSSLLGKLIRVTKNPNSAVDGKLYLYSVLAKGFHQPVGGTFYSTSFSAGLLIGDRGQAVAEEVDYLANGASGANFGWPFKEGFQVVRPTPPAGVVDPVADYPRLAGAAVQGIIGGAYAAGDYVFADRSGAIFTLPVGKTGLQNVRAGMERRTADFAPDVGAIDQPVAIVNDPVRLRLYILDGDGEVFEVAIG